MNFKEFEIFLNTEKVCFLNKRSSYQSMILLLRPLRIICAAAGIFRRGIVMRSNDPYRFDNSIVSVVSGIRRLRCRRCLGLGLGGDSEDEDAYCDENNADVVHEHQRSCKQHRRKDRSCDRLDG